jgi:hypothetical protein
MCSTIGILYAPARQQFQLSRVSSLGQKEYTPANLIQPNSLVNSYPAAIKTEDKVPIALPKEATLQWWKEVRQNIEHSEYEIHPNQETNTWQSFNRRHNMRIQYSAEGFEIVPGNDSSPQWNVAFKLTSIDRGEISVIYPHMLGTEKKDDTLHFIHKGFTTEYINTPEGMRQNFIIQERPDGKGKLRVELSVIGTLVLEEKGEDEVALTEVTARGREIRLRYRDLRVYDAEGKEVDARMEVTANNTLSLVVNDNSAHYPLLIDPLSDNPDWTAASGGQFVSLAGDVNGDGYDDVICGKPGYNGSDGRAFVYHGSAAGLSITPNWSVGPSQSGENFGYSATTAGDVNGDGYSDVIIGSIYYDNGQTNEGRAYVYHGSATGLSTTPDWTAEGNQNSAVFGKSLGTAGDVNGDGYDDIIVGAYSYSNGQQGEGRAYVYHGSLNGISATANWTAESNLEYTYFGTSVSTAGDVNGDGYSDVIVGCDNYGNGESDEGRAYVFHGSPTGLQATPNWTAEPNVAHAYFGGSVSTAGDINGDGYSDVIIGADRYSSDNEHQNEGRVYVYHGSSTGLQTTPSWTVESNQANAYFGWSIASAGDVNNDGYSDVIVGAPLYDNGQNNEGMAFIYLGSPGGLSNIHSWNAEMNIAGDGFGINISTAGDVNNDGLNDIVIGTNQGNSYAYYNVGCLTSNTFSITGTNTICEGDSVLLSGPPGYPHYRWNTGATTRTIYAKTSGIYRLSAFTADGCRDSSLPFTLNVLPAPNPVVTANGPLAFCAGDSVILSVQSGFTNIQWNTNQTSEQIIVKASGTYAVTVTGSNGCSASSQAIEVIVHPQPVASITASGSLTLCSGDSVTLTSTGVYPYYLWSTGETTRSIKVKQAGKYALKVTSGNDCSKVSDSVQVRVLPLPVPVITGDNIFCPGKSITLTTKEKYLEYEWSTGEKTASISISKAGTYRVKVTNANGCSALSSDFIVGEYPALPKPKIVLKGPLEFCQGDSTILEADLISPFYEWETGETTKQIIVKKGGMYIVGIRDNNGCVSKSDPVWIAMHPRPDSVVSGPNSACINSIMEYSVPFIDGESYNWSVSSSGTILGAVNNSAIRVQWNTLGKAKVQLLRKNQLCARTLEYNVDVTAQLVPAISGRREFCPGSFTELTAPAGYSEYRWSTNETTQKITVTKPGRYAVFVRDNMGCSGLSDSIAVTQREELKPLIRISRPTICEGDTAILRVERPAGTEYMRYEWFCEGKSLKIFTDSLKVADGLLYSVRVNDSSGCTGESSEVKIDVQTLPQFTIEGPRTACENAKATYNAGITIPAICDWTVKGGTIISQNGTSVTVQWGISQEAELSLLVSYANCTKDTSFTVVISNTLTPQIHAPVRAICSGNPVTLTADAGFAQYLWSTGETTRSITVMQPGTYNVFVSDDAGCSGTSADMVIVKKETPAPRISLSLPDSILCEGESIVLTVTGNYSKYMWSTGEETPSVTITRSGSYFVTVTDEAGCTATSEIMTILAPGEIFTVSPTTVDFGLVSSRQAPVEQAVFTNTGATPVTITGVNTLPAPFAFAGALPDFPVTVGPNAELRFDIRLTATAAGAYTARLDLQATEPCSFTSSVAIIAEVEDLPSLAQTSIGLPGGIEGEPGDIVVFPLRLNSATNITAENTATFSATVSFNKTLLEPLDGMNCVFDGDICKLTVAGSRIPGNDVLKELRFRVLLGNAESTPIEMSGFQWNDNTVGVTPVSGEFKLKNTCIGTTRLYDADGVNFLFAAKPNPVVEDATLTYQVGGEVETVRLIVTDAFGRTVKTVLNSRLTKGRYETVFSTADMPSGSYFYTLTIGNEMFSRHLVVVK